MTQITRIARAAALATAAGVDEADDVEEDSCDMMYSRTGRKNENGAPRIMLYCCNPNDRWIKQKVPSPGPATGRDSSSVLLLALLLFRRLRRCCPRRRRFGLE